MSLSRYSLTLGQKSTPLKNKLDSAMTRLDRLCVHDDDDNNDNDDDNDDGVWDENRHERRAKLFE